MNRYSEAECPYCEAGIDLNHDDGYGYEEGEIFQEECGECGKNFAYTSSMSWNFETKQAPCLNGGEHAWRQITGYPKEAFIGRFWCEDCGKEDRRDEEGRLKALKELSSRK